jgi:hypothetical protein
MPQVGIVRENAILPFTALHDMTGMEGRPIGYENGTNVQVSADAGGSLPIGVLLKGGKAGETVSVAIAAGGLSGTVRLLIAAPVNVGQYLRLVDGTSRCLFGPAGSGERIVMAQALETGLAGEKIEAVLFKPEYFAS